MIPLQLAERPIFTSDQLRQMRSWESRVGCKLHSLRGREWEILMMILEGLAFRRMAWRLSLSQGELDELLASLLRKLGLLSQSQLLTYCFEEHLDILVPLSSQLNQPPPPV